MKSSAIVLLSSLLAFVGTAAADVVHLDDVIVDGSLCVGIDCVDGEAFGFDTIRLKENNLRIKFEDTSASASFPTNDWQITVNETTNGGLDKFSIEDIDGGTTPVTIEAGAPSNSLYVDDGGDIGLGTSVPVTDLHMITGNTPTNRLEQDGSSGFTPQTWDVAGNEANFFVRDVTNGSQLPLRIRPGAPTSSIDISSSGDVGIGTANPSGTLHIEETDDTQPVQLVLQNDGFTRMEFTDDATSTTWRVGLSEAVGTNASDIFQISLKGTAGQEFVIFKGGAVWMGPGPNFVFKLTPAGDLTIDGTLTQMSDVNAKRDFRAVEGAEVLERLDAVPVSSWSYRADPRGARHVGPTAQDFHAAFGLGKNDRYLAPMDLAGVAVAGVKELDRRLEERDARIRELEARLERLEALLGDAAGQ